MQSTRNQRRLDKKGRKAKNNLITQSLTRAKQLHLAGNLHAAEQLYKSVLTHNPNHAQALVSLGNLAMQAGRISTAIDIFRRATKADPTNSDCYYFLGNALQRIGEPEEGEAMLREATEFNKNNPPILNLLGLTISQQGRFDEALLLFRQAITLDANYIPAYHNIATTKKFSTEDEGFKLIEKIYLRRHELSGINISSLFFAAGKTYDDLGRYDEAFKAFNEGNKHVFKNKHYDANNFRKNYEKIKSYFTNNVINRFSKSGCDSKLPIFILGMPRSGTTLVENILCNHTNITSIGESALLRETLEQLPQFLGQKNKTNSQNIYDLVHIIDEESLYKMGEFYVGKLNANTNPEDIRIVDKTPLNFLVVGLILQMLPNAIILHCKRNPLDTCLSIFQQHFTIGHDYAYSLEEIAEFHNLYQDYMRLWHKLFPSQIIDVNYESLVSDTENETRSLLASCGLAWEQQCVTRTGKNISSNTASKLQIRQPIYRSSVERWRKYEKHLAPLIKTLK